MSTTSDADDVVSSQLTTQEASDLVSRDLREVPSLLVDIELPFSILYLEFIEAAVWYSSVFTSDKVRSCYKASSSLLMSSSSFHECK